MKIARFFAVIFAVLGVVLMLGTAVVCFASTDASVKLVESPDGAVECSEAFLQAINDGDFSAAAQQIYGQPDLGAAGTPGDTISALVWDAFLDSISCEFSGKLYLEGENFARKVSITVLNPASVTAPLQQRASVLLTAEVEAATDMAQLYDEENNFRPELVERVLREAAEAALREDAQYVTSEATVKLICRDGKWWAVPDEALLAALSGNVA